MAVTRQTKKTETIEIRLSTDAKAAFMARCRLERRTASDALRGFIDQQAAPPSRHRRVPSWLLGAAGMAGMLLGMGVAVPSLARSAPEQRASFDQLDRNHDGVLTYREYRAR